MDSPHTDTEMWTMFPISPFIVCCFLFSRQSPMVSLPWWSWVWQSAQKAWLTWALAWMISFYTGQWFGSEREQHWGLSWVLTVNVAIHIQSNLYNTSIFQDKRARLSVAHPWGLAVDCLLGDNTGLILGLRSANERRRYFVTTSLIGWAQA